MVAVRIKPVQAVPVMLPVSVECVVRVLPSRPHKVVGVSAPYLFYLCSPQVCIWEDCRRRFRTVSHSPAPPWGWQATTRSRHGQCRRSILATGRTVSRFRQLHLVPCAEAVLILLALVVRVGFEGVSRLQELQNYLPEIRELVTAGMSPLWRQLRGLPQPAPLPARLRARLFVTARLIRSLCQRASSLMRAVHSTKHRERLEWR